MDLTDIKTALDTSNAELTERFERQSETLAELQTRLNRFERTGLVPSPAENQKRPIFPSVQEYESRAMAISSDVGGGFLVVPEGRIWFDRLRASNVVMNAGPFVVPMISDQLSVPNLLGSVTPAATGEGHTFPTSDVSLGLMTLFARKFGVGTILSRELVDDSNPGAREIVASDHLLQLGNLTDKEMLEGSGAGGHMLGLRNSGTVTTIGSGAGTTLTLDHVEAAILRLESANAAMSRAAIFMHPRSWSTLRVQKDLQDRYLLQPDPTSDARRQLFGVPVYLSTQITITETVGASTDCSYVLVTDMSRVVVGRRSDVGVLFDPYSYARQGQVALWSALRIGFGLVNQVACQVIAGVRP
jgi:HK97 family phage major capsid protein